MDLRILRYFLAVAQEENITKAADSLHVTQPTLSRTLTELEQELGKQLVIRGKRHLRLTQDGLLLRKRAMELIALADKTEAELREREDGIAGEVYIGAEESDGIRVLAQVCQELRRRHPGLRVRLSDGDGDEVRDRLDKGLTDLGLVFGPVDQAKYNTIELPFEGVWGLLLPTDDPLAEKDSIEPRDLWGRPLLLSRQALDAGILPTWFHREPDELNVCATYTTMLHAVKLAEGGLGCAMVIDGLFNLTGTGLCFRPCEPALSAKTSVIWKKGQVFSPPAELFMHALIERFS